MIWKSALARLRGEFESWSMRQTPLLNEHFTLGRRNDGFRNNLTMQIFFDDTAERRQVLKLTERDARPVGAAWKRVDGPGPG